MLHQERVNLLDKGGWKGQGPSKDVLDEREAIKQMKRVQDTAFTEDDIQDMFIELGIPCLEDENNTTFEPKDVPCSPLVFEKREMEKISNKKLSDPNHPYTFKKNLTPRKEKVKKTTRKSGRPKKKLLSRFFNTSDDELEIIMEKENLSNTNKVKSAQMKMMERPKSGIKEREKKETKHFKATKIKAYNEQMNYKIRNVDKNIFSVKKNFISNLQGRSGSLRLEKKNQPYLVDFQPEEVFCSCADFVDIKFNKMRTKPNGICKHIFMVILKCSKEHIYQYTGKREYSPNDYKDIVKVLKTFDEDEAIRDQEKEINEEELSDQSSASEDDLDVNIEEPRTQEDPDLNICADWLSDDLVAPPSQPSHQPSAMCSQPKNQPTSQLVVENVKGPFKTFKTAKSNCPDNTWFAEKYRKNKKKPKCKTCNTVIDTGELCLKSVVHGTYKRKHEYMISQSIFRFCLNNFCHKQYQFKVYTHYRPMLILSMSFLTSIRDRNTVLRKFENTEIEVIV